VNTAPAFQRAFDVPPGNAPRPPPAPTPTPKAPSPPSAAAAASASASAAAEGMGARRPPPIVVPARPYSPGPEPDSPPSPSSPVARADVGNDDLADALVVVLPFIRGWLQALPAIPAPKHGPPNPKHALWDACRDYILASGKGAGRLAGRASST